SALEPAAARAPAVTWLVAQSELQRAGGPGFPACVRKRAARDDDLLLARRLVWPVRELPATVGEPRALEELHAAVEPVPGVLGPVSARLALGEPVPHGLPRDAVGRC